MTGSLLLLCTGAFAAVSFATSALIGLVWIGSRGWRARLSPRAESRLALAAALAPALVALAALAAALLPSLGWLPDHCLEHGSHHPHLCVHHSAHPWDAHHGAAALPLLALAGLLVARWGTAGARVLRSLVGSARTARSLAAAARPDQARPSLHLLPTPAPEAFVLGVLAPRVYVSEGLMRMPGEVIDAVLAHERAHARRRDPLRRLVAVIALGCHLPRIAARLERSVQRSQEMAADADAADTLGDPCRVAGALVSMARARTSTPSLLAPADSIPFAGAHIEARVHRLLGATPGSEQPGPVCIAALAMAVPALMLACAGPVHHAVETLIGLLS